MPAVIKVSRAYSPGLNWNWEKLVSTVSGPSQTGSIPARQMKHLEPIVGSVPIYPYLWLTNHDLDHMRGKVNAVRELGFQGQFVWCWENDLSPDAIKAAKGVF